MGCPKQSILYRYLYAGSTSVVAWDSDGKGQGAVGNGASFGRDESALNIIVPQE